MKKEKLILCAASLASLTLLSGCSLKVSTSVGDEETTTTAATTTSGVNPEEFVGSWSSVRPIIDVTKEANNTYNFLVSWSSSAAEHTEWDYTCNFDEEKEVMECTGTKSDVTYTDEDNYTTKVTGKNQKAEFSLKDGKLIWDEKEENSAEDIEFNKD